MEKVSAETGTRAHKNLDVWKRSIKLAKLVYRITSQLPSSERFGLVSQMRRAVVSVASNLAEGAARSSKKEFLQFIYVAQGSASELDTQAELAKELGFLNQKGFEDIEAELNIVTKQLYGLAKAIRSK